MTDARPDGFRWREFCPLRLSVGIPLLTQLINKPPFWSKPIMRALSHYFSRRFLSIENPLGGNNPQSAANRCEVSNGAIVSIQTLSVLI